MEDFSQDGRDVSPLGLRQLSDKELIIIFEIERCFNEAKGIGRSISTSESPSGEPYLASVQIRYPRVLLLDGGRGAGKTSLLLTLVKQWHGAAGVNGEREESPDADFKKRIDRLRESRAWIPPGYKSPTNVRVIRILDFDPLPPEMPLVAGIIEAWHLLAKRCDPPAKSDTDDCDEHGDTLVDSWHKLFRIAAVGWTEIPKGSGLIEQVLDREEQVQDWQRLAEHWRRFIDALILRGKCLDGPDKLTEKTLFVIMIDDVDLQVRRVRELLPALRLLYHPNVFFLVAAHKAHMIDMLKLDFLGQQHELAKHKNANNAVALDLADEDRWASDLATSAFEKVFPKINRWELEDLSIREFLAFPGQVEDLPEEAVSESSPRRKNCGMGVDDPQGFFTLLNNIDKKIEPQSPSHQTESEERDKGDKRPSQPVFRNSGEMILNLALRAEAFRLPGVMTYRAAHQLSAYVARLGKSQQPVEVLTRLLSGNTDIQTASLQQHAPDSGASDIDVLTTGELAALYRPGPTEFAGDYNIVLSARPDFVFVGSASKFLIRMSSDPGKRFNFTSALIAKTLQEGRFAVHATGLRWETYLSLAWTEWPSLGLSFAWARHKHPRPDELFEHTADWNGFIQGFVETKGKLERYAYAWVYFQRKWWGTEPPDEKLAPASLNSSEATLPWDDLIAFADSKGNEDVEMVKGKDDKDKKDLDLWRHVTLPLLARPELGFPPEVQGRLLKWVVTPQAKKNLIRDRQRLVTDAFVAAEAQRGRTVLGIPDNKVIEEKIGKIDDSYAKAHPEPSPWLGIVEASGEPDFINDGSES